MTKEKKCKLFYSHTKKNVDNNSYKEALKLHFSS
ncbi:hypothetical protein SAMN04488121_1011171 [Chitinophaga filiformis]|uniref:Uncharacterized protein n=1 Tax=Chitinophaga filiformis TaxID=104663 RepID=A0A1G7JCH8_CHIFI|nr:hypothetical protein SAMN04488121_1011171 [Chitinophaga filiformis]